MDPTPSSPDRDFAAALEHHKVGQLVEAADLYERILAAAPNHHEARRLLGLACFQQGRATDAERLLRAAIASAPENAKAYDNLAVVLHSLRRADEALSASRKAVELAPANPGFLLNLGNLYIEMGRRPDAIDAFRRAVRAAPDDAGIHRRLAAELLRVGDAVGALRHLDTSFGLGAADAHGVALKAAALAAAGDIEAYQALTDFDRLVVSRDVGDAHGFPSQAAFHEALAGHVAEHAVGGGTAEGLLAASVPCAAALRRVIEDEIGLRLRTLPAAGHPFADGAPRQWRIDAWAVATRRQDHEEIELDQIRPQAWLSGVYYVRLSEPARPKAKANEGWLEFGRAPDDISAVASPDVRLLQPAEGMLLTFPAYIWRRTLPFETKQDRISIGFDVIAES
jgi:Flp pilus assembly protein TadD